MSNVRDPMRKRAWNTILSTAFFSVESAVIIALSIAPIAIWSLQSKTASGWKYTPIVSATIYY